MLLQVITTLSSVKVVVSRQHLNERLLRSYYKVAFDSPCISNR